VTYGKVVEPVGLHCCEKKEFGKVGRVEVNVRCVLSSSSKLMGTSKLFNVGTHVANGVIRIMRQGPLTQREFLDCTFAKLSAIRRLCKILLVAAVFADILNVRNSGFLLANAHAPFAPPVGIQRAAQKVGMLLTLEPDRLCPTIQPSGRGTISGYVIKASWRQVTSCYLSLNVIAPRVLVGQSTGISAA
jgi:hypothetical protein